MKICLNLKVILFSLLLIMFATGNVFADGNSIIFLAAENITGRWDPSSHTNNAQERLDKMIGDTLLTVDADNNLMPKLAIAWENIDDYTWELKLRKGVKFHNGTEMTAHDVKATIEYYTRPEAATSGFYPEQIFGEVVDDYTIRLRTTNVKAGSLLYTLVGFSVIVPAADVNNPKVWDKRLVGTGPWIFDRYDRDTVYTKANKDYWGGAPKVDQFIWKYVPDSDARLAALLTGEADLIDRVETEQVPIIEKSPNAEIHRTLLVEHIWLHFRNNKFPFKDNPKLRKAIAYGIDRKGIFENIMQGSGAVPTGFISPKQFGGLGESPYNFSYDPERAKELLAEAGYPNGEGLPTLEWIIPVGFYPKTLEYGEYIVQTLKDIGINIKLNPMETAAWGERLYNHEVGDMILCGWGPGTPEPDAVLRQMFHSIGRINAIQDPYIDEVLDKEMQIIDVKERAKFLHEEVNRVLLDRMPSVPLVLSEMITGINSNLKGWKISHVQVFDLHKAYFEK